MGRGGGVAILIVVVATSCGVSIPWVESADDGGSSRVKWAKRIDSGIEVVTNLQFYFHDTLSGRNPSAVRVAEARDTNTSLTLFGMLMMADDPLTEGPQPTSKLIGRARGLYGSAAQQEVGLIMAMSFGFTDDIYDGSSFSILGINSAMHPVREMTVVGGTGLFRMARGYAIAQAYWLDPITGDAIVGYNVTLVTYV